MKTNLGLALFALLSVMAWLLVDSHPRIASTIFEKKPQEYMQHAHIRVFNEQGFLKDELSVSNWAYRSEQSLSTLTAPFLTIHKPNGTIWTLRAKSGTITQPTLGDFEKIVLKETVVLERIQAHRTDPLKLETDELCYIPKEQSVTTEQRVTLNKPGLRMTGIGLRALLDQNTVTLLKDVKTEYKENY